MFTHNICACSIRCKNKQSILQDCEDDGDFEREECRGGSIPLVWKGSARTSTGGELRAFTPVIYKSGKEECEGRQENCPLTDSASFQLLCQ